MRLEEFDPTLPDLLDTYNMKWRGGCNQVAKRALLNKMLEVGLVHAKSFIMRKEKVKPWAIRMGYEAGIYQGERAFEEVKKYWELWVEKSMQNRAWVWPTQMTYRVCIHCGHEAVYGLLHAIGCDKLQGTFLFNTQKPHVVQEMATARVPLEIIPLAGLCKTCNYACKMCNAHASQDYNAQFIYGLINRKLCPTCSVDLPTAFVFPKVSLSDWRKLSERRK